MVSGTETLDVSLGRRSDDAHAVGFCDLSKFGVGHVVAGQGSSEVVEVAGHRRWEIEVELSAWHATDAEPVGNTRRYENKCPRRTPMIFAVEMHDVIAFKDVERFGRVIMYVDRGPKTGRLSGLQDGDNVARRVGVRLDDDLEITEVNPPSSHRSDNERAGVSHTPGLHGKLTRSTSTVVRRHSGTFAQSRTLLAIRIPRSVATDTPRRQDSLIASPQHAARMQFVYRSDDAGLRALLGESLPPRSQAFLLDLAGPLLTHESRLLDIGCRDAHHLVPLVMDRDALESGSIRLTGTLTVRGMPLRAGLDQRIVIRLGVMEQSEESDSAIDVVVPRCVGVHVGSVCEPADSERAFAEAPLDRHPGLLEHPP